MNSNKPQKKQHPIAEAFDYIEIIIFAAAIVLLLFTVGIRLCTVDGDSMKVTLEHGQKLIVSDLFYSPDNGDIIVFHQSDNQIDSLNKPLVKRVIATEGQYCKIKYIFKESSKYTDIYYLSMEIWVSDDPAFEDSDKVNEDYIDFEAVSPKNEFYELFFDPQIQRYISKCEAVSDLEYEYETRVPDGHVFVMGDNRYNSNDSRLDVGFVDVRCILGKIAVRLSPFGKVE